MIWHYSPHPGALYLQVVKSLTDMIQAVAIHPTGFYLVIGHLDRVKVYTIHPDDVAPAHFEHHDIRGCTEIQFSNGGNMYALNDDEHRVLVFSFWQNSKIANGVLTGHTSNVRSIQWLNDDTGLITVGKDDHQIILWKLKPDEEGHQMIWKHT